jgi:hypothetical protein
LKDLYPFFLAHLAETERRAGNYTRALSLADKALALKPGHPLLRFVRVRRRMAQNGGRVPGPLRARPGAAALAEAYGLSAATPGGLRRRTGGPAAAGRT